MDDEPTLLELAVANGYRPHQVHLGTRFSEYFQKADEGIGYPE